MTVSPTQLFGGGGQFLQESGVTLGAEDEGSFPMRLLHFRRTFVGNCSPSIARLNFSKRDGQPLGAFARSDALFPPDKLSIAIGTE